ncbi:MAG: hypothetical protein QXO30_07970 [Candidatus Caldarchaeum sp.]
MSGEQKKQERKKAAEKKKEESVEKGVLGVAVPSDEDVKGALAGLKVVTPSILAERLKVRVSIAKALLKQFVSRGLVREVVGVNRIRIYEPLLKTAAAPTPQASTEAEAKPKKAKKSSKKPSSESQP